jgi:hypothetical protein
LLGAMEIIVLNLEPPAEKQLVQVPVPVPVFDLLEEDIGTSTNALNSFVAAGGQKIGDTEQVLAAKENEVILLEGEDSVASDLNIKDSATATTLSTLSACVNAPSSSSFSARGNVQSRERSLQLVQE